MSVPVPIIVIMVSTILVHPGRSNILHPFRDKNHRSINNMPPMGYGNRQHIDEGKSSKGYIDLLKGKIRSDNSDIRSPKSSGLKSGFDTLPHADFQKNHNGKPTAQIQKFHRTDQNVMKDVEGDMRPTQEQGLLTGHNNENASRAAQTGSQKSDIDYVLIVPYSIQREQIFVENLHRDMVLDNKSLDETKEWRDFFNLKPHLISQDKLTALRKVLSECKNRGLVIKDKHSKYHNKNCTSLKPLNINLGIHGNYLNKEADGVKTKGNKPRPPKFQNSVKTLFTTRRWPVMTTAEPDIVCESPAHNESLYLKFELSPPAELYDKNLTVFWNRAISYFLPGQNNYRQLMRAVYKANIEDQSSTIYSDDITDGKDISQCVQLPDLLAGDKIRETPDDNTPKSLPKFRLVSEDLQIYSISAFYDMRLPLTPALRVLVVAPAYSVNLWCQIACKEYPDVALTLRAERFFLPVSYSVDRLSVWNQFIYSCILPTSCTITRSALTTAKCGEPESVFPVRVVGDPRIQRKLRPLAVCMSTMFDMNDMTLGRVVESFEAKKRFGINKILLYDTYNISKNVEAVIRRYEQSGLVERLPWRIPPKVAMIFYFAQVLQYTDCIYRNMDLYEYLALLDLDDVLIPNYKFLMNDMVRELKKQKIASYQFYWIPMCVLFSNQTKRLQAGELELYILSHTLPGAISLERKQVIAPRGVLVTHVHYIQREMLGWRKEDDMPALKYGVVYHFTDSSSRCRNFLTRVKHLTCGQEQKIQEQVAAVLVELDLIHRPRFLSELPKQEVDELTGLQTATTHEPPTTRSPTLKGNLTPKITKSTYILSTNPVLKAQSTFPMISTTRHPKISPVQFIGRKKVQNTFQLSLQLWKVRNDSGPSRYFKQVFIIKNGLQQDLDQPANDGTHFIPFIIFLGAALCLVIFLHHLQHYIKRLLVKFMNAISTFVIRS